MWFYTIEFFHVGGGRKTAIDLTHGLPRNRQHMPDPGRFGRLGLPVAARQTDGRSHRSYIRLFRYFILANRSRAGNDGAGTGIARISAEMKIMFFH